MRREGRIHGYEFEREGAAPRRVKASGKPTNRSKIRPPRNSISRIQEPPSPATIIKGTKALKKSKGQRNKALALATTVDDDEWTLRRLLGHRSPPASSADIDSSDDDLDSAAHLHPVSMAAFTPPALFLLPSVVAVDTGTGCCASCEPEEGDDEDDGYDSDDWLDLGASPVVIDPCDADEWFLC